VIGHDVWRAWIRSSLARVAGVRSAAVVLDQPSTSSAVREKNPSAAKAKAAQPAPQRLVAAPAPAGTGPRFGTCREAKGNGYGPYRQGQDPEYDWYRDADDDGVVCE
jgi:hypothetical protein